MIRRLRLRSALLLRIDLSGVEWLIGQLAVCWAICLLLQPDIFSLPAYRGFVLLGVSAPRVAGIMLVAGSGTLGALLSGSVTQRRCAQLGAIAFWAFMSGVFFKGGALGVTPYLSTLFAVNSLLALLSLRMANVPLRLRNV